VGLFNRAKSKRESGVTLTVLELPAGARVGVVGESHYQDALGKTAKLATVDENGERVFRAILVHEPENEHDPNAIAVWSEVGQIGHLSREAAAEYQPVFAQIARQGSRGGTCTGELHGGTRDKPSYGVVLRLSIPRICLGELQNE
jgi:HIRAN domain